MLEHSPDVEKGRAPARHSWHSNWDALGSSWLLPGLTLPQQGTRWTKHGNRESTRLCLGFVSPTSDHRVREFSPALQFSHCSDPQAPSPGLTDNTKTCSSLVLLPLQSPREPWGWQTLPKAPRGARKHFKRVKHLPGAASWGHVLKHSFAHLPFLSDTSQPSGVRCGSGRFQLPCSATAGPPQAQAAKKGEQRALGCALTLVL